MLRGRRRGVLNGPKRFQNVAPRAAFDLLLAMPCDQEMWPSLRAHRRPPTTGTAGGFNWSTQRFG